MTNLDNVKRALEALKQGRLREQILRTCRHCGMTSMEMVLLECEGANEALAKKSLHWLSRPNNNRGFPALLESLPMKFEGRPGRPQQGYLLTPFGRDVYTELDPEMIVRLNNPRDEKDLAHRFTQLQVVISALRSGWKTEVEKVLPYAGGEVRCDVFVESHEGDIYIEIEQELTRNNAARAAEKFRNWQAYACSANLTPNMYFVFNLPDAKIAPTLALWQETFERASEADDFALDVRYLLAGSLEGKDLGEALDKYSMWMEAPAGQEQHEDDGAAAFQLHGQAAAPMGFKLQDATELLPGLNDRVRDWQAARHPKERLRAFFALMEYIYKASYAEGRGEKSDVYKYCLLPERSLWLLRHYMNLPQNQATYEELKQALIWAQRRSGSGLIILRNTISGIFWDTFLKHHRISMGGALQITIDVPDYVNFNSTFEAKARFLNAGKIFEIDSNNEAACKALAWVLSAFFLYPEVLETGEKPWKKKPKKGK